MGAYDNPRIIQPPNYTEIFMKNFAMGQATVEKAFAGQKAKKKQREAKLDAAYQATSTIRVKGQAINAGDMTANIRKQTNTIADDFYANELAYIDEKIDRQTYQNNRDKHLSKLQGMVDIGGELSKVDLSNIKVSRHQKDRGKTLGLVEAYNNRAVDIDYSGDLPKLYYMDPFQNRVEVDLGALKNIDAEDLDINEVYTIDKTTKEGFVKGTYMHTEKMSTTKVTDGAETIIMQVYDKDKLPPGATKEDVLRINEEYEQGIITKIDANLNIHYNDLDDDEKGSLFADTTFASYTMGKNENNEFQKGQEDVLNNMLSKIEGITDEDIKHVKEQLLNGTYNGTNEQKAIMDQVSKDVIANQIFNSGLIPKAENKGEVKSEDAIRRQEVIDRKNELSLQQMEEKVDDDQEEITNLLDYFSQDTGPLGFGGNVTKAKSANKFIQNMKSNGFFDANNNFKTTAEIIKTIRDTKNQGVYGYDVTQGQQFKNFKTADEINDIIPTMKNVVEEYRANKGTISEENLSKLKAFGFDTDGKYPLRFEKYIKYFEEKGIDGTTNLYSNENVNSYFEFGANKKGFLDTSQPKDDRFFEDGGAAGTQKFLADLPLSNDSEGGTKVSIIDIGNIVNELYDKKGLYQYLKFN